MTEYDMKVSKSTGSLLVLLPLLTLVPNPSFSPVTSDSPTSESKVTKDFSNIQTQTTTSTYENPAVGLKFEYPSEWDLQENPTGLMMNNNEGSVFSFKFVDLVPNSTLQDFARYQYTEEFCCSVSTFVVTTINDNQTTVGQNSTASQLEYTFQGAGPRQGLVLWVINNDIGYQFNYISDQGPEFSKNLPAIRKVLDSVEFIPIEVEKPKVPSFMQ